MRIILSAIVAGLVAQNALAEPRENKAFRTVNGRSVAGPQAASAPRFIKVNHGGAGANVAPAPAPAATATAATETVGLAAGGTRAAIGGGRAGSSATVGRGVQRRGKTFRSGGGAARKIMGGGIGGNVPEAPTEELPPHYTKPGALIRTTGQQPKYEKAEDARVHTVDAGEIVLNPKKAFNVGQAPHLAQADKPDKLPPPNPGTSSRTSTGGASANSPTGSTGGSGDNNGNGNNPKGKPGDDNDPHPTLDDTVNSAY